MTFGTVAKTVSQTVLASLPTHLHGIAFNKLWINIRRLVDSGFVGIAGSDQVKLTGVPRKFVCKGKRGMDGSSDQAEYNLPTVTSKRYEVVVQPSDKADGRRVFHFTETGDSNELKPTDKDMKNLSAYVYCPLRIVEKVDLIANPGKRDIICWDSPSPSSPRLCVPVYLLFRQENKELFAEISASMTEEVVNLKPTVINHPNMDC
jgi:hypothetical protein